MAIEDEIRPETVNEVLLLNRIRDLQIQLYTQLRGISWPAVREGAEVIQLCHPAPINLRLAAAVESEDLEYPKGIRVLARTNAGKFSLGYQYYMTENEIKQIGYGTSGQLISLLHNRLIRGLAYTIEKEKRSESIAGDAAAL